MANHNEMPADDIDLDFDEIDYGEDDDFKSENFNNFSQNDEDPMGQDLDGTQAKEQSAASMDCDDKTTNHTETTAERCKYYPFCNAGSQCPFYHPNKPCKTFPNCRFGQKCLYIHPLCKFNPNCARPGCTFAHPAKVWSQPNHYTPPAIQKPPAPRCKYGFDCKNLMCEFTHQRPDPCRFGENCLLQNCPFTHPADVAKDRPANKFKWTAQSS